MNPDPKLRYPTAAALRDDLQRFRANEPIEARRVPLLKKVILWCRRDPKSSAAALIAFAALVTATVASSAAYIMTSAANDRTTAALNRSEAIVDLSMETLNEVVGIVSIAPSTAQMEFGEELDWDTGRELTGQSLSASPQSAEILESLRPLYQGLLNEAPTRPDIIRRMVDASVQHAKILQQLGKADEAIETIQYGIGLLEGSGENSKLPLDEKSFRLASLYNNQGDCLSSAFKFTEADEAHQKAISILQSLPTLDSNAQLELASANLHLGDLPPQRRRARLSGEQKDKCIANLNAALEILDAIEVAPDHETITMDVLRSRVHLGLSRLINDPKLRHESVATAIEVLKSRLAISPDDSTVRFELVKALSGQDLRKTLRPFRVRNATGQLSEALTSLKPLRSKYPNNSAYAVAEVHIHHKLANLAKRERDYSQAKMHMEKAIEIQSMLVKSYPESISHLCWRALLYRSLSGICMEANNPAGSAFATEQAVLDLDAIPETYSDHPFVKRVRDALPKLERHGSID